MKSMIRYKENKFQGQKAAASGAAESQPQTAQHMDAVPCSTPVAHVSKNRKKVRSFPVVLDHSEEALEKNALAEDSLVPIRLDMEFEGKNVFYNS